MESEKLQKLEQYINEEIKPFLPLIVQNVNITYAGIIKDENTDSLKKDLVRYIDVPRYGFKSDKRKFIFYKPVCTIHIPNK